MKRPYMKALEELIKAKVPSESVHLAVFLFLHPGRKSRTEVLAVNTGILDIESALEPLVERSLVQETGGRWEVFHEDEPVPGEVKEDINATLLLEAYQAERVAAGQRRLRTREYPYALEKFGPLAAALKKDEIDYRAFVRVANVGFQFVAEKDESWVFVRPEQLASKFARTIWERDTDEKRPGHAGHSYAGGRFGELRRQLEQAGFDGSESLTENDLRSIERYAKSSAVAPDLELPSPFEREIRWLAKRMRDPEKKPEPTEDIFVFAEL